MSKIALKMHLKLYMLYMLYTHLFALSEFLQTGVTVYI